MAANIFLGILRNSQVVFVVHSALPGVRNGCAEMDSEPANLIWFIPA